MVDAHRPAAWLGRRIFDVVWRNNLVYNQCWEDPAVDREALALTPADTVLAITSAGCNVLDYALSGARVVAVDANPRQNHLLELKLAAIRALDFDAFFAMFGRGGTPRVRFLYQEIRRQLLGDARAFWDHRIRLFDPDRTRGRSFYYSGTAGLVALALRLYLHHLAGLRKGIERILDAADVEDQLRLYRAEVRRRLLGGGFLEVLGSPGVLSLLGVPGPQRDMVTRAAGGFAGFIATCLDHVMSVGLLRENYFWSVYLRGGYSADCCPEYLKPENFARLKQGLAANVRSFSGTVTQYLKGHPGPVTAFVLLDHMDWMAVEPRLVEEEWSLILAAAGRGARAIFRSGAPDARVVPPAIQTRLRFETDRARALHQRDRVGTYGSFHIAHLAAA